MPDKSFFESVLGDPEDDELLKEELGDEEPPKDKHTKASEPSGNAPQDSPSHGSSQSKSMPEEEGRLQEKTITVAPGQTGDLAQVNRSIDEGWRLFRIALNSAAQSETSTTAKSTIARSTTAGSATTKVVIDLRRDEARSLFGFD